MFNFLSKLLQLTIEVNETLNVIVPSIDQQFLNAAYFLLTAVHSLRDVLQFTRPIPTVPNVREVSVLLEEETIVGNEFSIVFDVELVFEVVADVDVHVGIGSED